MVHGYGPTFFMQLTGDLGAPPRLDEVLPQQSCLCVGSCVGMV